MNEHIELVKKWLADPESVSKEELRANYKAAWAAFKAAWAAYCDVEESNFWVKKYEELTK